MSICVEKQKIRCGMTSRIARHIKVDENSGKMAVVRKSRSSGTHDYIEFYNILSSWLAVPELTVCPENGSIEHILFVENGELMSSHANGSVCFIDPHNMSRIKRIQISASTIWAACKHKDNAIALISHSSVLYFFDVSLKTIISSLSLGVESRLFDVTSNGSLVAIGSIDSLILAADGKVQQALKLDRQNSRDPTIAWSVLFIKPTVLACGDSSGVVTLWNVLDGSLMQSITCLQSHILTMVTTNSGTLNVAGVDPRITELKETSNGSYEIVNRRNGPVRDVRSMAVYENTVFAAGEDFDIYICKSGCQKLLFHQQKNVLIASDTVACAGENYIDVYWKQKGENEPPEGSNILQQHYEMIHLAKIYAPKQRVITCWTISPCGEHVVIGTCHETTIYKISPTMRKHSSKVIKTASLDVAATSAIVTQNLLLYLAKSDFEILEYRLIGKGCGKEQKIIISQTDCGSVTRMVSSPCGKNLCLLTTRSQIFSIETAKGDSRLMKVDLPIDMVVNSSSCFVLTTVHSTDLNRDNKKIFHEVGLSNGLTKRSASSNQLRMLPSSPKSLFPCQPVYLFGMSRSKIMTVSYDGHWSIVDVEVGTVFSAQDGPLRANKKASKHGDAENSTLLFSGARLRKENEVSDEASAAKRTRRSSVKSESFKTMNSRILQLEVSGDELPKTSGFKLKKFGMQ